MAERATGSLSLEKQLSKFPTELLNCPCVESHLGKLVHCITTDSMVLLAPKLGLTNVEVEDIREVWSRNPPKQRLEMFKKWQQKDQSQATYRWAWHSSSCVRLTCTYICVALSLRDCGN